MTGTSEQALSKLLIDLKNGDVKAFNTLYEMYAKMIYHSVLSMVKDESISEELLQDLFLKIWQKRALIDPKRSFKSLLYSMAKNLGYDYFRKVAHDKKLVAELMTTSIDNYTHVEEVLEVKETKNILNEAINQLPPKRKTVYILCKNEGKSHEDISRLLGISVATVNDHMVKSNSAIRRYLRASLEITLIYIIVITL